MIEGEIWAAVKIINNEFTVILINEESDKDIVSVKVEQRRSGKVRKVVSGYLWSRSGLRKWKGC